MDQQLHLCLKELSFQLVLLKNQLSLTAIDFSQTEHALSRMKKKKKRNSQSEDTLASLGLSHFLLSAEGLGLKVTIVGSVSSIDTLTNQLLELLFFLLQPVCHDFIFVFPVEQH